MRVFFIAVFLVALANSSVYAWLGGFEPAVDGYRPIPVGLTAAQFQTIVFDVALYNAGQFGTRTGGVDNGSAFPTPTHGPLSLWNKLQGALQPAFGADTGVLPFGYIHGSYATGHLGLDRTFVNSGSIGPPDDLGLVITTNADGWAAGPSEYSYKLDQYDLNGSAATGPSIPTASAPDSRLKISWWSCAQIFGLSEGGGLGAGTIGDTVSFYDSSPALDSFGQPIPAFEVGYIQTGTALDNAWYRAGNTGANGAGTSIPITLNKYHRWDVTLDLKTNTVEASLFDPCIGSGTGPCAVSGGTTYTVIPAGTPTMGNMADLAEMRFTSTPGVNNEKKWSVDDFQFCVTEAPLSSLLNGGTLWSGDKQFSEFSYHGGGDMPAAEDVWVKAITDADGNFGIRFQGAFVDAFGGGASDALIDYTVTAGDGQLITDVNLAANPLVIGGNQGLVSITETFLPDNDDTVLSVYDIKPGSRKLMDGSDLLDENGDLAAVKELHVQKDIIAWSQGLGSVGTLSFIDQTFSQCNEDPSLPGVCGDAVDPFPLTVEVPDLAGDFNLDGTVDAADYIVWRKGVGTVYTATDLEAWRANFGQSAGSGASNTVPEPASLLLVALAAASAVAGRDRRGCRPQREES